MHRELAHRESDGISVTLYWHSRTDRLSVVVENRRDGDRFAVRAPASRALDFFEHPYAYAAVVE